MSEHIPHGVVRAVRARAGRICEYCHLPQILQEAAFHIDHISPRSAEGSAIIEALCTAQAAVGRQPCDPVNVCPQNGRCLAGKGDVVVDFLHVIAIVEHA
jgi:hypothetical protein